MNAAKPDRNQLIELTTALTEITAAWDATDEVDTNLGADVKNAGDRLGSLLAELVLDAKLPAALHEEVGDTYLTLTDAVTHYSQLDEHDPAAARDIYGLLAPTLALLDRALDQPAPPPTYPHWNEVAEPYADGTDPIERYVVTLVVGSDEDTTAGVVTDPKQAALSALDLTRDDSSRSTVWHVYDRHTGTVYRYDQSEFDPDYDTDNETTPAATSSNAQVVGDTLVLPPQAHAALEAVAAECAATASGQLTRTQIEAQYGHDLPEDMGEGPFPIYHGIDPGPPDTEDDGERCTVARAGDYVFCLTCEAQGHLDGYLPSAEDIERWHRDL